MSFFWTALFPTFLIWLPRVVLGSVFLFIAVGYFGKNWILSEWNIRMLLVVIIFRVFYPFCETIGQYFLWKQSAFGQLFLPPHQAIWYVMLYALVRFWINAVLALAGGYLFYILIKTLKKHNERFFEEGEVELGTLIALIVGWPGFVLFVPFLFAAVLIISMFKMLFMKEKFTTLGTPFFLSAFPLLFWSIPLIDFFNLGVVKI